MNIWKMILCIGLLVMIITIVDATAVLSSKQLDMKNLAKRFVKLLEAEIQTWYKMQAQYSYGSTFYMNVTLVSKACKTEPVLKQLDIVQQTLSDFELELTPDCFTNSQEYTGKRNTTISGLVCQNWKDHVPHEHHYNTFPDGSADKAGNYCRDPEDTGTLWCLTLDRKKRDEDCSVPRCDTL